MGNLQEQYYKNNALVNGNFDFYVTRDEDASLSLWLVKDRLPVYAEVNRKWINDNTFGDGFPVKIGTLDLRLFPFLKNTDKPLQVKIKEKGLTLVKPYH